MTRFAKSALGLFAGMTLALALMAGCEGTTKSGTKYTVLPSRELQASYSADLATVHDKSVALLKDKYQFNVTREARDAMEGVVEATTARNDKVTVQTYAEGNMTTVQVWFGDGPFGSQSKAQDVLESIEQSLGIKPTEAAATANPTK
jgi:hypothetical protein